MARNGTSNLLPVLLQAISRCSICFCSCSWGIRGVPELDGKPLGFPYLEWEHHYPDFDIFFLLSKLIEKTNMKGWTVVTQRVKKASKGVAERDVYLTDKHHPNHKKTENIVPIYGGSDAMQCITYAAEKAAALVASKGKGGRPAETHAIEFTLNMPKGYRPTPEQWRNVMVDCVNELAKACGVSGKELAQTVNAVLHQQMQDGESEGTGDHLHLVVGKWTQGGKSLPNLQKKVATARLKLAFNESMKKRCGYDWTEYRDNKLKAQDHANKRRIPPWKLRAARQQRDLDAAMKSIAKMQMELKNRHEVVGKKEAEVAQNVEFIREWSGYVTAFHKQSKKWLEAFEVQDNKQLHRQRNRLARSVGLMNELIDESPKLTSNDELMRFESSVEMNEVIDKINSKSPANKVDKIKIDERRNRMKM